MKNNRIEKRVELNASVGRALPGKKPLWKRKEGDPPPPENQGAPGDQVIEEGRFFRIGNLIVLGFNLFAQTDLEQFREERGERYREHTNYPFTF